MRRTLTVVLLAGASFVTATIYAVDEPYGSDTLPRLFQNAALIVQSSGAKPAGRTETVPRMLVFNVQIKQVFKAHKQSNDETVSIQVPAAISLEQKEFSRAILFLAEVHDVERAKLAPYELMGGRHGLITNDARFLGTERYLTSRSAAEKAEWAGHYLKHDDSFFQRSAVFQAIDLASDLKSREAPRAFELLNEALNWPKLADSCKVAAVRGLSGLKTLEATKVVAGFAENSKTSPTLRREAMRQMVGMPTGRKILEGWTKSDIEWLADEAKLTLALTLKNGAPDKDEKPLKVGPDGELRNLQRQLKDTRKRLSDKLDAIQRIAAQGNRNAAVALDEVARDAAYPEIIRCHAILGIARMESGVVGNLLRALGRELKNETLRELAEGLAIESH